MNLLKGFLILVFCGLFFSAGLAAQDSIVIYTGKYYKGKILDFDRNKAGFHLQYQKKSKLKTRVFRTEDVFALYYKDSASQILYAPLITEEEPFSVDEMTRFVAGENLAQYRYHAPWASVIGAVTGIGMFNLGMWGVAIPAAYVGFTAAMPTLPKAKKYFPAEKLNDDVYVDGFKYVAKRKKLVNAAIGSAASLVVCGTIAAIITFKYYND